MSLKLLQPNVSMSPSPKGVLDMPAYTSLEKFFLVPRGCVQRFALGDDVAVGMAHARAAPVAVLADLNHLVPVDAPVLAPAPHVVHRPLQKDFLGLQQRLLHLGAGAPVLGAHQREVLVGAAAGAVEPVARAKDLGVWLDELRLSISIRASRCLSVRVKFLGSFRGVLVVRLRIRTRTRAR